MICQCTARKDAALDYVRHVLLLTEQDDIRLTASGEIDIRIGDDEEWMRTNYIYRGDRVWKKTD